MVFAHLDDVPIDLRGSGVAVAAATLDRVLTDDTAPVLTSARTRAELELVRHRLGIRDPFICEHGSAVVVPAGCFPFAIPNARSLAGYQTVEFGRPYAEIAGALRRTAHDLGLDVIGFSDMSIGDVARECRLPLLEARLAKLRDYEEPFRLLNRDAEAWTRLCRGLQVGRLRAVRGRVFDYAGAPVDPRAAVRVLASAYRKTRGDVLTASAAAAGGSRRTVDVTSWAEGVSETIEQLQRRRSFAVVTGSAR